MGCDIHCYVEKRRKNGKWLQLFGFVSDYYIAGHKYFGAETFKSGEAPVDQRNYQVFGILAGVRREDDFPSISKPRGLPLDVSKSLAEKSEDYGCDNHSHSWITVREIMDYDQTQPVNEKGVLKLKEFQQFLETGLVSDWFGGEGIFGNKVVVLEPTEVDTDVKQVAMTLKHAGKEIYVKAAWTSEASLGTGEFFSGSLNQLKARCRTPEMDDVRLVFWFDN